jgi:hypothetical protein
MITGVTALAQDCACALKAQYGEMFLQPTDGMPTLSDVWLTRNYIKWRAAGIATLSAINGVVRVVSFVITTSGTILTYSANILTVYSPTLIVVSNTLDNPA